MTAGGNGQGPIEGPLVSKSGMLDITRLALDLQGRFAHYDRSLKAGQPAAFAARGLITAQARQRLREIAASNERGFYLFADRAIEEGLGGLRYVGCAPTQSIENRVKTYLLEDISSLDAQMLARSADERRRVADRRMRLTILKPQEALLPTYCDGHMRSLGFAAAGSLFMASCNATKALIEGTEGILIASAWTAGAELGNANCTLPGRQLRAEALELASEVLRAWGKEGLPIAAVEQWCSIIQRMADDWTSMPDKWEPY